VTVRGAQAHKPSTLVDADEPVAVLAAPRRFASRGGEKLDAALERFDVDVVGRGCLDAGASTGGFTDCLLRRRAANVIAVDVGYGQLAWELRNDSRVVVLERTNVRDLDAGSVPFRPSFVAADLSFISLKLALPPLVAIGEDDAEFVVLVKPQFEAGREDVGSGGVVRDPAVWRRVIEEVAEACRRTDLAPRAVMASPLLGPAGNAEFLLYAARGHGSVNLDVDAALHAATELAR
jgi:23S rRNA (cytidine1920-2'-O)/16S rRNA (cytidine1409-2'-O)-methyltransferase